MFGHTALAGNFLILIALCLWAYREKYKDKLIKKIVYWTLLLMISASIHIYYVPMIVIIMFCTFISEFIEDKKTYISSIITFVIACMLTVLLIYLLGGFTNNTYEENGLGDYNANLNAFINPHGHSKFIKSIEFATEGEHEGFGYLGLGILLMCFLSIIVVIQNYKKEDYIKAIKNPNVIFVILSILIAMIVAIGTTVKLGSHILFEIEYPEFILKILSAFRSTGRFIWIPCYMIFFTCMYVVSKNMNKKVANIVITICLIIQLLDLYPYLKDKFTYEEKPYTYNNIAWNEILNGNPHIACIPISKFNNGDFFKLAYIAKENNCTINNFYFARKVKHVEETSNKYIEDIEKGITEEGFVYILKKDDEEIAKKSKLLYNIIDDYIVITSKQ